jgi:hypothetical protein
MIPELARAGHVVQALVAMAIAAGFPPFTSGAFWGIVTVWGIVTILFDDETPRGVPGAEYWRARQGGDGRAVERREFQ